MNEFIEQLTRIIEILVTNLYVTATTILLSIVGFVSPAIYRRRSLKFRELSAICYSTSIVSDRRSAIPNLQVTYSGQLLDTITVTTTRSPLQHPRNPS
jgi:hypothetical protein